MTGFLVHWLVMALALFITTRLVGGIQVNSYTTLAIAALVIGFVNALVKPVLLILTLPLTILTLGLFVLPGGQRRLPDAGRGAGARLQRQFLGLGHRRGAGVERHRVAAQPRAGGVGPGLALAVPITRAKASTSSRLRHPRSTSR